MAALVLLGASAAPAPRAPEVKRTAVIDDRGGERLMRSPLAIALDRKSGEIVVSSFESGEVIVLDRSGALVARFGAEAGLVTPYGVAVDARGRIFVSEVRTGLIKILGPGGATLDEIDLSQLAGRTVSPGRISLGEDGLLYVADLSGNELLVLKTTGELVREIGPFPYLQKGAVLRDGRIVALSGRGSAVTVFDASGARIRSFAEHGEPSERTVSFPTGFAVDGKGRIWIADAFQHRLKVFSLEGKFLYNVGRPEETTESGGFFFPVDLCFGNPGELLVLEKGAERIQTFQVADLAGVAR
ncbi:MAG TPA: NHL repeat-containing protein [Anaeromyxobacter sp.]